MSVSATSTMVHGARVASDKLELPYWRLIGPHRGGRVVAVAGDPLHTLTFYFGSTGGGVWKTTDAGLTWRNVSDGYLGSASVGAIAVAPSDPNVLYVGMGEATIRGNVSFGDGVYRSTDAGKSWRHMGLDATRHIGKVRVDPRDAERVYVAAFGHAFGPHEERGVYRSTDGGAAWERVLYRDEHTGAVDLVIDPTNPRILYASLWQARRGPHYLSSGGPGSGLFRSADGGDTWEELTGRPGLPSGLKGKLGVAVSPARPERVWALVEADGGSGLYRSDNDGATWKLVSDYQEIRHRPWYYMHIYADPQDPETVWVLNLRCWRSTDGGHSFMAIDSPHVDNHDMWIDPQNPLRMINGSDGGGCISFNGGVSWSSIHNQPTAEMYHVTVDNQAPYRVYGPQQDNTGITIPSFSTKGAITSAEWYEPGGGECGYMAVHPDDPNIVYGGSVSGAITRYDHRSQQVNDITVWPDNKTGYGDRDLKYRFQWTFPIVISPHDANTLYATGNHVFRSTDEGWTWESISPDLSRNDPATMEPSGGPITLDNVSTETYGTVFTFAESPVERGLLWAGSDDGLIHISRDDGGSWQDVSIPDLPEWSLISIIEASPHDSGTAWVAATRYKHDDPAPYLFRTTDFGQNWTKIVAGIRDDDYTRVIREDPVRPDLLFAGTERGVYVSRDGGGLWQPLVGNLPVVPVHNLVIKESDLVVATHGRSFWILDDITPLRQWPAALDSPTLFTPRDTYRFKVYWGAHRGHPVIPPIPEPRHASTGMNQVTFERVELPTGESTEHFFDAGKNPPAGVIVNYYLPDTASGDIALDILDVDGNIIRSYASTAEKPPRLTTQAGLNRIVWNMRYPDAAELPGAVFWFGSSYGPTAVPGVYQVRLRVGEQSMTESFEILKDPRVPATQEDLLEQYALHTKVGEKLSELHETIGRLRHIRRHVQTWHDLSQRNDRAQPLSEAAEELLRDLDDIEGELIQTRAKVGYDAIRMPIKLNNRLAALIGVVSTSDTRPTQQMYDVFEELSNEADAQLERFNHLLDHDVIDYNNQVSEVGLPAIAV